MLKKGLLWLKTEWGAWLFYWFLIYLILISKLCTHGLGDMVSKEEAASVTSARATMEQRVRALLNTVGEKWVISIIEMMLKRNFQLPNANWARRRVLGVVKQHQQPLGICEPDWCHFVFSTNRRCRSNFILLGKQKSGASGRQIQAPSTEISRPSIRIEAISEIALATILMIPSGRNSNAGPWMKPSGNQSWW